MERVEEHAVFDKTYKEEYDHLISEEIQKMARDAAYKKVHGKYSGLKSRLSRLLAWYDKRQMIVAQKPPLNFGWMVGEPKKSEWEYGLDFE